MKEIKRDEIMHNLKHCAELFQIFAHFQWAVCLFVGEDPNYRSHTWSGVLLGNDKTVSSADGSACLQNLW